MKILRKIFSVILGIVIGGLVGFYIERLGHENLSIYQDVPDMNEMDAFAAFIANLPLSACLILLFAHATGTIIAGFIATLVSGETRPTTATAVGAVMLSFAIINIITITSHPVWFKIAEASIYFPAAILGFRILIKTKAILKQHPTSLS
jgi:hypothetical protein